MNSFLMCQGELTYFWIYNVLKFYLTHCLCCLALVFFLSFCHGFHHLACSHLLHMKNKTASHSVAFTSSHALSFSLCINGCKWRRVRGKGADIYASD